MSEPTHAPDAVPSTSQLFDLSGRVAVVTGASRGIGEAVARAYAGAGAAVVLASRTQEALDEVAESITAAGGKALPIACHTGDPEQIEALVARTVDELGGVDVLFNNAGTNPHFGPILTAESGHWDKTYEVNVKGYAAMAKACLPAMKERGGGKIVNVASIVGLAPHPGLGVYAVSKAAVLMLTRVLALELASDGIQVNAIAPGLVKTRFSELLWTEEGHGQGKRNLRQIPAGRFGEVDDLLGIALYLASRASDWTTGAVFTVDGGHTTGAGG
jgi:NAD(P)-dependent dehydrogenase (short-subunit alcohol dehydrogenase family)